MALSVKINGSPVPCQELTVESGQNQRDRLNMTLISSSGSDIRPTLDHDVLIEQDSVAVFGGSVRTIELTGLGTSSVPLPIRVSALDYNELADRQIIFISIPAGTLRAAATLLIPYLDGVTLGTWASDGPSLSEMVFDGVTVEAALQELQTRSGWLRAITYQKKLMFWAPNSVAAPFSITDGDTHVLGDMVVSTKRTEYANRVVVKFMDVARKAYAFLRMETGYNFADGETVTIGSKTYTFKTTLTDTDGYVKIGNTGSNSLNNLAAAIVLGAGAGTAYAASTTIHGSVEAYEQTSRLMKCRALVAGASGNSISVGETSTNGAWVSEGEVGTGTLTFGADEAPTNSTTRNNLTEQGLYGIYTRVVEATNVFDLTSANALGDAILTESIVPEREVTYSTRYTGLAVGQYQIIASAMLHVSSATYLITELTTTARARSRS